jgi:hypothetical protein
LGGDLFWRKFNFLPWKWTLGPKLSRKKKQFFFSVKIKSFVPIFYGKPPNTMFLISDRVLIVFGDPSQQWATLIIMKKKLVKSEKKYFSL